MVTRPAHQTATISFLINDNVFVNTHGAEKSWQSINGGNDKHYIGCDVIGTGYSYTLTNHFTLLLNEGEKISVSLNGDQDSTFSLDIHIFK